MPSPFQTEQNDQETQELSEFGSQFLSDNVPEEHRAIVEQYIKPWDGNVTKKFQELQGKVKTYEELGDPQYLTNARNVLQEIQESPVDFYNYFRDYLLENAQTIQEVYGIEDINQALGIAMDQMENGGMENGMDPGSLPEFEGVRQQFVEKFQTLEKQLEEVSSKTSNFEQSQREQEQMAILDSTLEKMHTEHGDFDEEFVLTKIASGRTPDQAIQEYQKLIQSVIDSQSKPPTLMNGPSGTPLDQVDKTKLRDPKFRKALGAEYLTRSLQS